MLARISLQTRLFVTYSLIVILLIGVTLGAFYARDRSIAYANLLASLNKDVERVAAQMDNLLFTADLMTTQIKNNADIANTFYLLAFEEQPGSYFQRNAAVAGRLQEIVSSIAGVDVLSFYRIAIIGRTGAQLSIGAYADPANVRSGIANLAWIRELDVGATANGVPINRLLLAPHPDPWGNGGKEVISLVRRIDTNGYFHSLVEIQVPYAQLAAMGTMRYDPGFRSGDKKVWVFGRDGELVVPSPLAATAEEKATAELFYRDIHTQVGQSFTLHSGSKSRNVVAVNRSRNSEWTVAVSESYGTLMEPIRRTGYLFAAIALMLILLSLTTIYYSTRLAVRPLRQLSRVMSEVPGYQGGTDGMLRKLDVQSTQNEVAQLYRTFRKMLARLEESKEVAVQSYSRELHAQFIALQAQINPHFLYNTLSLVGVMGRAAGNPLILRVCTMLVEMLRYVTYDSDKPATIRDEMAHTHNYLAIMKTRYEDHLLFAIEVPAAMDEIALPKLTIQPFVENAIKHAFVHKKRPWKVSVIGSMHDDGWRIAIRDDGAGFAHSVLDAWAERSVLSSYGSLLSPDNGQRGGGGSGIVNTYARLHIAFGARLRFALRNLPEGGAEVEIAVAAPKP
ncbi:cache domain-containing sensor histidine kinase [Paenibacillus cymbidii]|uniref:cache domain-containing sensor histidine kinase n=1 Tax=Paenibacillus cymbidii TaxID=1639034 RepID=UPI001080D6CB|nr:histidine kinase [Paenibacillus cymbidii]